jgi:hypothetical protein
MRLNNKGFILPITMTLIVVMTIGGFGFLHLKYLENKLVTDQDNDHSAFYLANAGIERAKTSYKIATDTGTPNWTSVLDGSDPDYPTDNSAPEALCPSFFPSRGCAIPPFQTTQNANISIDGHTITSPEFPFDSFFDNGSYTVRAFNNEPGTTDTDQIITLRAMGAVDNETKVLEITARAVSGLKLINCQGNPGDPCPDDVNQNAELINMGGKDPESFTALPQFNEDFYRNKDNFPWPMTVHTCQTDIDCSASKTTIINAQSGHMYILEGPELQSKNVQINASNPVQEIVVFSEIDLEINGNADLTDVVLISKENLQLQGNITVRASLPFPALIAEGNVGADNSVEIYGGVYSAGDIDFRPIQVHGVLIGQTVDLQGAATLITDDNNPDHYQFMPGFTYPDDLKSTATVAGTWREIQ